MLARSLPASLAIVCALFAELALGRLLDHSFAEISTVCMMITVVIGLALIYRISRPLTPLRSALLVAMSGLVLLSYTVFGEFFHVVRLAPDVAVFTVVLAALSITLFEWTSRILPCQLRAERPFRARRPLRRGQGRKVVPPWPKGGAERRGWPCGRSLSLGP